MFKRIYNELMILKNDFKYILGKLLPLTFCFFLTFISSAQITRNKVENILNEIIEINSYTTKGETKKLLLFFENNNLSKNPDYDDGLSYIKYYPDNDLDYLITIEKTEIECILVKKFNMQWNKFEVKIVYDKLKSMMGLPPKTFYQINKQLKEESKKINSTYIIKDISNDEFIVINNKGKIRYVKSKFADVFSKNPKFGESRYFKYNFVYVYPYNENAVFNLTFEYFIDNDGNYTMSFKVPLKQNNLDANIRIDPNKI